MRKEGVAVDFRYKILVIDFKSITICASIVMLVSFDSDSDNDLCVW